MSARGLGIRSDRTSQPLRPSMVVLNRIYTRTGDKGTTALASGERRPKHDLRIEAYGTVDETNACIGMARLHTAGHEVDRCSAASRTTCSISGPISATPATAQAPPATSRCASSMPPRSSASKREIDRSTRRSPLRSFVLPGGHPAAAHLCISHARSAGGPSGRWSSLQESRARRSRPMPMKLLNRLSDFLFVASRYVNDKGARDVLWVPGAEPLGREGRPMFIPLHDGARSGSSDAARQRASHRVCIAALSR